MRATGAAALEDYIPGEAFRHARGKTVGAFECAILAQLVMNTSDGHFNDDAMRTTEPGRSVLFGAVTLAIVIGLATEDTAESAVAEVALRDVRFLRPVCAGDTLYAASEVLAVEPRPDGTGDVTFRHVGLNADDDVVLELVRTVRVRRGEAGA